MMSLVRAQQGEPKKKRPVFWAFFSFLSRFLVENGLFLCQIGRFGYKMPSKHKNIQVLTLKRYL